MRVFTISDLHFNHGNIINLCSRPYVDVKEMNRALIDGWNATVGVKDMVYFLGDFGWGNPQELNGYLKELNGTIKIMRGNHDKQFWQHLVANHYPNLIHDQIHEITIDGYKMVLSHYPIEDWNGRYKGVWHYHGHVHNKETAYIENRMNVCVEKINYVPHLILG
jgi:calcineurin-like phosphoesterase family protein